MSNDTRLREHHLKVAEHSERAAKHHKEAVRHEAAGNYEMAADPAYIALDHHRQASFHLDAAVKDLRWKHGIVLPTDPPVGVFA